MNINNNENYIEELNKKIGIYFEKKESLEILNKLTVN